jgi:hypothetical protein
MERLGRAFRCGRGQAREPAPTRSFAEAAPVGAQRPYPVPVAFPFGVVKKAKKNRRRVAPEGVRPLSPLPGHSPPPGGGEQASAEARFGQRRVRYPRPFGARRFPCFFTLAPLWGERVARSAGRGAVPCGAKRRSLFLIPET